MTVANTHADRRPPFARLRAAVNRLPLPAAIGLAVASTSLAVGQYVIGFVQ